MTPDLIEALRERSHEIDRQIETFGRKIAVLRADLSTMRAVMHLHEGDPDGEYLPHMSVRRHFGKNEIRAICFDALLVAPPRGIDTAELARAVMARKGMDGEDVVIRGKIIRSVAQAMKTARRRRFVVSKGKSRGRRLWALVDGKLPDQKRLRW